MNERIEQAADLIRGIGYEDIAARLSQENDILTAENYRIAVVGEFKTGKSTLINRIFLKEDLLFTDILEATAVPTEIRYGSEKLLEVIPYGADETETKDPFAEDGGTGIRLRSGQGKPVRFENPSPEQIRSHTSAETAEGRNRLARETARVRLFWPADNLDGLTLFDTPGINSLNAAVIATTYRIIPEADLVLFVTAAKGLSSVELEFLSSRVLSQGITRLVTVVTHDSRTGEPSDIERERLRTHIGHQLASIGKEAVPIEMVDIRDRRSSRATLAGGFKVRVEKTATPAGPSLDRSKRMAGDVIRDLLGESGAFPKGPEPPKDESILESLLPRKTGFGFADLEARIIDTVRRNVRPARMEKAARVFDIQLRLALSRCSGELSVMEKSEADRRRLRDEVRARDAETRLAHERMVSEFRDELRAIQKAFTRNLDGGLRRIGDGYVSGFEACEGLGALQSRLENARRSLGREIEEMFLEQGEAAREEIRDLIRRYGAKSQRLLNPWQSDMSRELRIDAGVLSRIPPFALLTLDILLFARFGPFGPLADILIRLLAQYIPYLNRMLPVAVAGAVLRRKIHDALTRQFEQLRQDLPDRIEAGFQKISESILSEWNDYVEGQLSAVRSGIERAVAETDGAERRALLRETRARLEGMLEEPLE